MLMIAGSCKKAPYKEPQLNILPTPEQITSEQGFSRITELKLSAESVQLIGSFSSWFASWPSTNSMEENLVLIQDYNLGKGSYGLKINDRRATLSYADNSGLANGLSSLYQLLTLNGGRLPIVTIKDKPAFHYRGMHLDVARHFYSVAEIKKYLDYLSFYKMNKFHWHLTDDQGWRIEIKKYPKLQEVSAFRQETLIGHYNDQPHKFDGKKYGGYYTQEQIKDIISYAGARGIEVIPEIDIPGHSTAILAAYPEYGCTGNKIETATKWGVFFDVLCPKEETFAFLEEVFSEIALLFPSNYIHIGGDECPKDQWKQSAFCQELMKREGLNSELELQSYFIKRVERSLNKMGKTIIGWDEILEGGIAPNATIMSWRGVEGGIEAAKEGHDVIMTPTSHCYFDYYQSENPDEPLAIGGFLPYKKVYNWHPIPKALEGTSANYVLGGQGNVWSEYLKSFKDVEYMMLTRMITLSEVVWGKNSNDLNTFSECLLEHTNFWKETGANVANHLLDLEIGIKVARESGVLATLSASLPAVNYFTKSPDDADFVQLSKNFLTLDKPGDYLFYAQKKETQGHISTITYKPHIGTRGLVSLEKPPADKYGGNGAQSICNGIEGPSERYGSSEWLGFSGDNLHATIDFFEEESIERIDFKFFKGEGQWIFLPRKISIYTIDESGKPQLIASESKIETATNIAKVTLSFSQVKEEKINIVIENHGIIGEGLLGGGNPAWLFVDEIIIN